MHIPYLYLTIAILAEVCATMSIKAIGGLKAPLPLIGVVFGYGVSFWMLTLVVKSIPVGIAYAIWAGAGIVLVALLSALFYGQKLDAYAMTGMFFIVTGVVMIQLLSSSAGH